jgi:pyridoxal phosphate enzyme (YggS family)
MIGHLQTNKAKQALSLFSMIHSVDRIELAQELEKQCDRLDISCDVLVQANVAGEETKFGADPDSLVALVQDISRMPHLRIRGLMTIAPYTDDPSSVRPVFAGLRHLAERIADQGLDSVEMAHLSMGMSGDFEVAIEEGATIVRIGTAIFGPRQPRAGN